MHSIGKYRPFLFPGGRTLCFPYLYFWVIGMVMIRSTGQALHFICTQQKTEHLRQRLIRVIFYRHLDKASAFSFRIAECLHLHCSIAQLKLQSMDRHTIRRNNILRVAEVENLTVLSMQHPQPDTHFSFPELMPVLFIDLIASVIYSAEEDLAIYPQVNQSFRLGRLQISACGLGFCPLASVQILGIQCG